MLIALSLVCVASVTRLASTDQSSFLTQTPPLKEAPALAGSPCATVSVCAAANRRASEIMNANRLEAVTVVQDVRTGAVIVFAASQPSRLDVTTPVMPLSLSKLLLSASWWDNRQPDLSFDSTRGSANAQNPAYRSRVSVHEMLVGGSDSAGRQMAIALRKSVGTKRVIEDLKRYGFGPRTGLPLDNAFWGELAPSWKTRLVPAPAYISLSDESNDSEWAEALSLGETDMSVTALHVSRFLQAVGNNGVMLTPVAVEQQLTLSPAKPTRIMQEPTALRLQSAMRDTVERGTAKSIAQALENTGWRIGGKTGSGPGPQPIGPQSDGWFAGLIFDPQGKARFTVATFVRHGGAGGGNAAKVSAELARFLIGDK
ncbi:MAG TPA: penicillin-binding transpeptidase domain-containing protein [Blastocatellia bacterium]|nr:penicillin-binding transpeptidase domain-containing protein [Blastocatellia bacterium]